MTAYNRRPPYKSARIELRVAGRLTPRDKNTLLNLRFQSRWRIGRSSAPVVKKFVTVAYRLSHT
jgi:hypothetical protein